MNFLKKRTPAVQQMPLGIPSEPPKYGYDETKSILFGGVVIRFSVPDHVWNELRESKEWNDFQALLEKHQTEYVQKQHQVAEYPQEYRDYM